MNLKKLLVGHPIRLKYVTRFSTCRTLHKESVAEHVYFTILYAQILGCWIENVYDVRINFGKLLFKALIHDLEECITGDIPRDFKHSHPLLNKTIDNFAGEGFKLVVKDILQNEIEEEIWFNTWYTAKDDTLEGKIVTFADFLSVISYVYEETRIAKSIVLREQLSSLDDYYHTFTTKKYELFKPLVEQVTVILKEIFNGTES